MVTEQPGAFNVDYHLARFHRVSRRYGQAIHHHYQGLMERRRTLGPDHPDTLRSSTGLANSFYAAGYYDEALALFRDTLERRSSALGPEHPIPCAAGAAWVTAATPWATMRPPPNCTARPWP